MNLLLFLVFKTVFLQNSVWFAKLSPRQVILLFFSLYTTVIRLRIGSVMQLFFVLERIKLFVLNAIRSGHERTNRSVLEHKMNTQKYWYGESWTL